jgi:hypothetical protein
VPEAEKGLLLGQVASHALGNGLDRAELLEHPHRSLVRTSVRRPLEGADRGGDRGVHVCSRAGYDAGREGRRVQFVLGMQDQGDLEGTALAIGRELAREHRQEVFGVPERGVGLDDGQLLAKTVVPRDDGRQPRNQRGGLAPVVCRVDCRLGRVGEGEQRCRRPQHLHRRDVVRIAVDQSAGVRRQLPLGQPLLERGQLLGRRQVTLEQKERDLLVRRMLREIGDVVAAVTKDPLLRVDGAERRLGDHHARERDRFLRWFRGHDAERVVPRPVMPSSLWVASTKPEAALGRSKAELPC